MKEYLKQHNISIYNLSRQTGIPYSTLNDIINRKTDIDNVRFGHIKALSSFLGLSLDQFAMLFDDQDLAVTETEKIVIRNKTYYLSYRDKLIRLCKVTNLNSEYIHEMAEWKIRDIRNEELMSKWEQTNSI